MDLSTSKNVSPWSTY